MTVTQLEHASTFTDPLPCRDTFDRLEGLVRERRSHLGAAAVNKIKLEIFSRGFLESDAQAEERRAQIVNRLTRAELRRAEVELEIVEVARLLVAEASNAEIVADTPPCGCSIDRLCDGCAEGEPYYREVA